MSTTGLALRGRALGHGLAHKGELTLLGLVAKGKEALNGLLARSRLAAGNNTTLLEDQIALLETTRGLTSCAVEDLCFRANTRNRRHVSICRRDYLQTHTMSCQKLKKKDAIKRSNTLCPYTNHGLIFFSAAKRVYQQ